MKYFLWMLVRFCNWTTIQFGDAVRGSGVLKVLDIQNMASGVSAS